MSSNTVTYFGYGSLVNRATRPAVESFAPARLRGWQRVWSHRIARQGELDGCSSLNVREAPNGQAAEPGGIDGVIATIDRDDLPQLDARESGYDRRLVPASQFDLSTPLATSHVAVYVSSHTNTFPASACHPLLQTYIDCVMAGFLERFGEAGLLRFLISTEGWQAPVVNDRARPRYVRAQRLPGELLNWFDSLLQEQRLAG